MWHSELLHSRFSVFFPFCHPAFCTWISKLASSLKYISLWVQLIVHKKYVFCFKDIKKKISCVHECTQSKITRKPLRIFQVLTTHVPSIDEETFKKILSQWEVRRKASNFIPHIKIAVKILIYASIRNFSCCCALFGE